MPCYNLNSTIYQVVNNTISCPVAYQVKSFDYDPILNKYYVVDINNKLRVYDYKWKMLAESNDIKHVIYYHGDMLAINSQDLLVKINVMQNKNSRQIQNREHIFLKSYETNPRKIHHVTYNRIPLSSDKDIIYCKYNLEFQEAFDKPIIKVATGYECLYIIDQNSQVWIRGYNHCGELALNGKYYKKFTQVPVTGVIDIISGGSSTIFLFQDGSISYYGKDIGKNTMTTFSSKNVPKVCINRFNNYFLIDGKIIETGDSPQLEENATAIDIASYGNQLAVLDADILKVYHKYGSSKFGDEQIITEKPLMFNIKSLELITEIAA